MIVMTTTGDTVTVWTDVSGPLANDIIRQLMRQTRYPWVMRKLNSARWHIIETRTRRVEVPRAS